MITEDYVSFETAKFLKEKEFDVPTENFYDNTGENLEDMKTIYGGTPDFGEVNWNADPFVCEGFPKLITFSKPSQSLALKWLREEKHYYIQIMLDSWALGGHLGYYIVIQDLNSDFEVISPEIGDVVFFNTYEEAVEEALKYVLGKLI